MSSISQQDGLATARPSFPFPKAPEVVGRYRVLFELGRGGMASVYLAVTQGAAGVTKLVVLKTLLHELEVEPDALAMFLDEARLAVQLNHGNLVQTYEISQDGERHFIVMEYLDGQSLAHVLRRAEKQGTPLPLALHLRVLIHVLEGLHYTHELRGYDGSPLSPVHRDVSPQNVFITFDGRTKLLDFGVAKAKTSTTHTADGFLKGKIAYMCPEQMAGEAVDRRADVYSVGCMLWAAAAGRKLWKDADDVRIVHGVVNGDLPRPSSVNPDCDPELERIVMKALARLPTERYPSALELQEDLERLCEAKGFHDRPREFARFVSELFADFRTEMRARIERELSLTSSGITIVGQPPASLVQYPSPAHVRETSPTTRLLASTLHSLEPRAGHAKLPWALVALLSVAGVAYSVHSRSATPTASAPPAQPTSVIEPATKDSVVRSVRAERTDHGAPSPEVSRRAESLPPRLEEPPADPHRTRKVSAAPAPKKTAAKSASSATGCAQPFFVDVDGIKKIKPGCL